MQNEDREDRAVRQMLELNAEIQEHMAICAQYRKIGGVELPPLLRSKNRELQRRLADIKQGAGIR